MKLNYTKDAKMAATWGKKKKEKSLLAFRASFRKQHLHAMGCYSNFSKTSKQTSKSVASTCYGIIFYCSWVLL